MFDDASTFSFSLKGSQWKCPAKNYATKVRDVLEHDFVILRFHFSFEGRSERNKYIIYDRGYTRVQFDTVLKCAMSGFVFHD